MVQIENYLNDGADWQAKCVLNYLQHKYYSILDATYNADMDMYRARLVVGRYENCREQGYVFTLRYCGEQKNYCVFQHRNSDNLCVIMNQVYTINTPTIEEIWEGKKDKWDYDKDFSYGEVIECAKFIEEDMKKFINLVDDFQKVKKEQNCLA